MQFVLGEARSPSSWWAVQYVHYGGSLVSPTDLSNWAQGSNGGAGAVQTSVASESGPPWSTAIQTPAWWLMAYMAKASGVPVATLSSTYHWTAATQNAVTSDLNQIG